MSDDKTRLYPAWKQAVLDFLDLDPQPGTTIDDAWLDEHFDMTRPGRAGPEEWKNYQLKRLKYTDEFKAMLAEKFNLILSDRHGGQMRVLAPAEVAQYTEVRAKRDLRSALKKQVFRLKNTNVLDMTPEQRRDHVEVQARAILKDRMLSEAEKAELPMPTEKAPLPRLFTPDPDDPEDGED